MTVTLRPITLAECQLVREWRNDPAVLPMLRTGYKTEKQQERFYYRVIAPAWWRLGRWFPRHKYYALERDGRFVGMGGLTHIDDVFGAAEISLIVRPEVRGFGLGALAVEALLAEATRLGMVCVSGECYSTGNIGFWTAQIRRRPATLKWEWTL